MQTLLPLCDLRPLAVCELPLLVLCRATLPPVAVPLIINAVCLVQVGQMLRLDLYSENIPVNLFGARARGGPRDVPARRPRGRAAGRGAARRVAAAPAIPTVSALDLVLL